MQKIKRIMNDELLREKGRFLLGVSFCIVAISGFFYLVEEEYPTKLPFIFTQSYPFYQAALAFSFALALGVLVGSFNSTRKVGGGVLEVFSSPVTWPHISSAIWVTSFLILPCLFGYAYLTDPKLWKGWVNMLLTNPGGIFAIFTGAATFAGTYIAIHSILEMKHTITSFPQLMERVTHLINEKGKDPEMGVLFLAFTPLPGSWNAGNRTAKNLKNALGNPDNKISVACLKLSDGEDHTKFLNLFNEKEMSSGKISSEVINEYHAECVKIASVLKGDEYDETTKKRKAQQCVSAPIELEDAKMPGYYFFVSSERAIIAIPVGMPTLKHPNVKGNAVNVQTLGFETTDRQIIDMLQKEFERYTKTT